MKRFFLITIVFFLLAAGFSIETLAVDAFDASAADGYVVSEADATDAMIADSAVFEEDQAFSLTYLTRFIKDIAVSTLSNDFGFREVHGQPLPGVLLTLLLGAAFGLARRRRGSRHTAQDEQNAAMAMLIAARLFRLNILYSNPPTTIHAISPGPDLFCLRE